MALELRVPTERVAPPKDLEIRPKQARAWVESLPLSHSMESGRKILANLCAVNRAKVEFDDRLQLYECYRPIAHVIFDELDAVYGKALLPLPAKCPPPLALLTSPRSTSPTTPAGSHRRPTECASSLTYSRIGS